MRMLGGVVVLWLVVATAPSPAAAGWARPVEGPIVRAFALGPDRFAAGQHRGVDLAAPPGGAVRSACGGRVSFAGRVPGGGLTVSVRCGRLIATYQHLGATAVRRGLEVLRGTRIAVAGRSGLARPRRPHVHVGVRDAATGAYVDPMTLFGGSSPRRPPVPVPAPRVRTPRFGPAPARGPRAAPHSAPVRAPTPAARLGPAPAPRLPLTVWLGLACVGLGLPLGGFVTLRRRRRRAAAPAVRMA